MSVLKRHPNFESLSLNDETAISIPGLEIYPDRRKISSNHQELDLTTKEYDLLCLLVANKGRVLTYEQIYQKIWHEEALGNENNAIGCHIRNLRENLARHYQMLLLPSGVFGKSDIVSTLNLNST